MTGNKKSASALFLFLCFIQGEDEFRSNSFCADHVDILIVCVNDFFDNGKPQAGSLPVLAPGGVSLVKTVPDLSDTALRYPGSMILDGHKDFPMLFCGFYRDD